MSFPRILLLTWWRPTIKYAGGEILRRVVGVLPSGSIRWAFLSPDGDDGGFAGLPENRSFALKEVHWRLEKSIFHYAKTNYFCAGKIVDRIAEWVKPFTPELIWIASDMDAIGIGLHLKRRLRLPLHVTVYDAYEYSWMSGLHTRLFSSSYMHRVHDVLEGADSFDAVSQELVEYINVYYPGKLSRRSLVFPPSTSLRQDVGGDSIGSCLIGKTRRIGFCGSSRISDHQWQAFLDLLGKMDFSFELVVYTDQKSFNRGVYPGNVKIRFMSYVSTETEIIKWFVVNGVCACYLGLWKEKERTLFVRTSLSSKLTTYATAGLPVIVDAPEDSVAWRLVRTYDAGILLNDIDNSKRELNLLFSDSKWRQSKADGSRRLCDDEFDLIRNVGKLTDLFSKDVVTVGKTEETRAP